MVGEDQRVGSFHLLCPWRLGDEIAVFVVVIGVELAAILIGRRPQLPRRVRVSAASVAAVVAARLTIFISWDPPCNNPSL